MATGLAILLLVALAGWVHYHQNRPGYKSRKRSPLAHRSNRAHRPLSLTYERLHRGQRHRQTITFSAADLRQLYAAYPDRIEANQALWKLVHQQPGHPPRWYITAAIARKQPPSTPKPSVPKAAPPPPPPRPQWMAQPVPAASPTAPPPASLLARLDRLTGNRHTTNRLVAAVAQAHPHRSPQWHGEKALWDLERDRHP